MWLNRVQLVARYQIFDVQRLSATGRPGLGIHTYPNPEVDGTRHDLGTVGVMARYHGVHLLFRKNTEPRWLVRGPSVEAHGM